MIPLVIDPARVPIALVGRGIIAAKRLIALRNAGAKDIVVYSDAPEPVLLAEAGEVLVLGLPDAEDFARLRLLWVADIPEGLAEPLAEKARAVGLLVNVEDVIHLCDFHNVAQVRRGDLVITVSTNGKSPRLASRIRQAIETTYGPEWAARLDVMDRKRRAWRKRRRSQEELTRLSDMVIDGKGWFDPGQRNRDQERRDRASWPFLVAAE